jgi:hypothetical protein
MAMPRPVHVKHASTDQEAILLQLVHDAEVHHTTCNYHVQLQQTLKQAPLQACYVEF